MSEDNKLATYISKRDFSKTSEPEAKVAPKSKQPVFVIQLHDASHLHYDFRLEIAGVLKSWAIPKGPSLNPKDRRLAVLTEDHPFAYKDFEGIIPDGEYGAGEVIIWDQGTYENKREIAMEEAFNSGKIEFKLKGKKLQGGFVLIRTKGYGKNNNKTSWLLIKEKDKFANTECDITAQNQSVVSNKKLSSQR